VTAYAACALVSSREDAAYLAAAEAGSFLAARASHRAPGFGYNGQTTRDADSTAWACRLAAALETDDKACFTEARQFLATCQQADGGFATYPTVSAVRQAIQVAPEMPVDAWASSHTCVTAATAILDCFNTDGKTLEYLRAAQKTGGEWRGYWWCDPEYATALAIQALSKQESQQDRLAIERAVGWLEQTAVRRCAFPIALRLLAFSFAGRASPSHLVDELLKTQRSDGSWTASARLRLPFPGMRNPDLHWDWDYSEKGFGGIRLDQQCIFTTATAVWALASIGPAGTAG
jgi:hypothetical protein